MWLVQAYDTYEDLRLMGLAAQVTRPFPRREFGNTENRYTLSAASVASIHEADATGPMTFMFVENR